MSRWVTTFMILLLLGCGEKTMSDILGQVIDEPLDLSTLSEDDFFNGTIWDCYHIGIWEPQKYGAIKRGAEAGNPLAMVGLSDYLLSETFKDHDPAQADRYDPAAAHRWRVKALEYWESARPENPNIRWLYLGHLYKLMGKPSMTIDQWKNIEAASFWLHYETYFRVCLKGDRYDEALSMGAAVMCHLNGRGGRDYTNSIHDDTKSSVKENVEYLIKVGAGNLKDEHLKTDLIWLIDKELLNPDGFIPEKTELYPDDESIFLFLTELCYSQLKRLASQNKTQELPAITARAKRFEKAMSITRKQRIFRERVELLVKDYKQAVKDSVAERRYEDVQSLLSNIEEANNMIDSYRIDPDSEWDNPVLMALKPGDEVDVEDPKQKSALNVILVTPNKNISTENETTPFIAVVQSSYGIRSLNLIRNGVPLQDLRGVGGIRSTDGDSKIEKKYKQKTVRTDIPLVIGLNKLELKLVDLAGREIVKSVNVTRTEKPGKVIALVVGISDYKDKNILDLPHCEADAKAMHKFFDSSPKSPVTRGRSKLLTGSEASATKLKAALFKHLVAEANPEDTVIFYFAGHGDVGPDGSEYFMIPQDAQRDALSATAIELSELQRIWSKVQARRKIFITDSCNSGGFTTLRNIEDIGYHVGFGRGSAVFAASSSGQKSLFHPSLKRGLFTLSLLDGLQGKADSDADGRVSLSELSTHLTKDVTRRAKKIGGHQQCISKLDLSGTVYLSKK